MFVPIPKPKGFGGDFFKEAETLSKFHGRIQKVLDDLEKSPAAKKNLDHETVSKASFGSDDFVAAGVLAPAVEQAHARIKELAQVFQDLIEGLGLAALNVEKDFEGLDAEQAARLREIQERATKYKEEQHQPVSTPDVQVCGPDSGGTSEGKNESGGKSKQGKQL
ncbi:hypothetical protein ACQUSR_08095 [Streptomyces sp. P1-3]|uniref:hypothetical protein n=1 Tax=Streptomyces sp. P1-3 TaxID=3421658 RepID=UPI003D3684A3